MCGVVLRIPLEQAQNVLHTELANSFAAFKCCVCELALFRLEVKDALLDRVGDCQTVDCHVLRLVEAVDTVNSLLLYELCIISLPPGQAL